VLAAVVFYIGVELVDINGLRLVLAQRPGEFVVAVITASTVVFIGVKQAIFLTIVVSLLEHVRRSYKPKNSVLIRDVIAGTPPLGDCSRTTTAISPRRPLTSQLQGQVIRP
jgi:MFS superfamily sulfate permease-like transporter